MLLCIPAVYPDRVSLRSQTLIRPGFTRMLGAMIGAGNELPLQVAGWPFVTVLTRLAMSVGLGVFIGLEREHNRKAGVRTFALVAVVGCVAGMMGDSYSLAFLGFVAMTVAWMNYRQMLKQQRLVLTTSAALTVVAFCAILFGQGHRFTPGAAGIITAALLAWKQPISRFVVGLNEKEVRSAVLLALLTVVVLPVLPAQPVDPWNLIEPRSTWISVVLIAGIGFVNYVLMRLLGPRGMEITAFFGGLVNSRKVIVELAGRLREIGASFLPTIQRGLMLATVSMLLRNGLIVAMLAPQTLGAVAVPLGAMSLAGGILWWRLTRLKNDQAGAPLALESPFRLSSALKFGLVFMLLNIVGALAQRSFGDNSFYFVSIVGGLLSSASSIAAAAALVVKGEIPSEVGVTGIVLSSVTSILVNIPLLRSMIIEKEFAKRAAWQLVLIALVGLAGLFANRLFATG